MELTITHNIMEVTVQTYFQSFCSQLIDIGCECRLALHNLISKQIVSLFLFSERQSFIIPP